MYLPSRRFTLLGELRLVIGVSSHIQNVLRYRRQGGGVELEDCMLL